jgi:hypothetical protein
MIKQETVKRRIETARKLVERSQKAVERRKRKIENVSFRLKKGRVTDKEFLRFNEFREDGMTFEEFLVEEYTDELWAYEERLIGAKAILEKYEEKAKLLEETGYLNWNTPGKKSIP